MGITTLRTATLPVKMIVGRYRTSLIFHISSFHLTDVFFSGKFLPLHREFVVELSRFFSSRVFEVENEDCWSDERNESIIAPSRSSTEEQDNPEGEAHYEKNGVKIF